MLNDMISMDLAVIIVNDGKARKIIKHAKLNGAKGATVFYGMGSVKSSKIIEFFELHNIKKEIIIFVNEETVNQLVLKSISEKFKFNKPNHGIAFTIPITSFIGSKKYENTLIKKGSKQMTHQAIFTIVDRGKAEEVIKSAKSAGAKGGTIINARGSGIHETEKVFNFDISPEKEVVIIVSEAKDTDHITKSIRNDLKISEPGNGIIFVQDVSQSFGILT